MVSSIISVINNPSKIIGGLLSVFPILSRIFSDEMYLRIKFRSAFGRKLDLKNPKTFNEKIQWLKLNNRKPVYSTMVDKYEAKKYAKDVIGSEYIIPTLGVWDKFDDIDFSALPNQFVLKCTHDSGGLVICRDKDKFDYLHAKKKITKCLKKNYYWEGREWPYKHVQPRIIAEMYLEDHRVKELRDYKFFCFNGTVKLYKVDFDRFVEHHANYYDIDGKLLDFGERICPPVPTKDIEYPDNLHNMIELAELLASGIPFLRVDFYDIEGNIYFGELTFSPASGFGRFTSDEWDIIMGSWLKLQ